MLISTEHNVQLRPVEMFDDFDAATWFSFRVITIYPQGDTKVCIKSIDNSSSIHLVAKSTRTTKVN